MKKLIRKLLRYFNFSIKINQYGRKYSIPVSGGIFCIKETEINILKYLELLITDNSFIIDIGANVGETLIKTKSLNKTTFYIGVDPISTNIKYLDDLIRNNNFENCTIVCCALGNESGFRKLFRRQGSDAVSSIATKSRPENVYDRYDIVPVMTGDELIASINPEKISLIKIDVEGAENEVIRGFGKTLATHRPAVLFECLPLDNEFGFWHLDDAAVTDRQQRAEEIVNIFSDLQYNIYHIMKDGEFRKVENFSNVEILGFDEMNFMGIGKENPL